MMVTHITEKNKQLAAELIGEIDGGEKNLFLEYISKTRGDDYYFAELFSSHNKNGVFFSFPYYGKIRILISFTDDATADISTIIKFIEQSIEKSAYDTAMVWVKNENRRFIRELSSFFGIEGHAYESVEYVINKTEFKQSKNSNKDISCRHYEEEHLDSYLSLLDKAMTFCIPPCNFAGSRDRYRKKFEEHENNDSFYAFWNNTDLVGLYWREGCEIDIMAVSPKHQRKGYGSHILTHAIRDIFKNEDGEIAYLYCVDWNVKGQEFYKKYGMKPRGHSYLINI